MTFDDLRAALAGLSTANIEDTKLRGLFIGRLDSWRTDSSTADRLLEDLNRLLGQVWFSDNRVHQRVFEALEAFGCTVREIAGMTMNERLFTFGLSAVWDVAPESTRTVIRSKLGAE